jgi:hypothetical protein
MKALVLLAAERTSYTISTYHYLSFVHITVSYCILMHLNASFVVYPIIVLPPVEMQTQLSDPGNSKNGEPFLGKQFLLITIYQDSKRRNACALRSIDQRSEYILKQPRSTRIQRGATHMC